MALSGQCTLNPSQETHCILLSHLRRFCGTIISSSGYALDFLMSATVGVEARLFPYKGRGQGKQGTVEILLLVFAKRRIQPQQRLSQWMDARSVMGRTPGRRSVQHGKWVGGIGLKAPKGQNGRPCVPSTRVSLSAPSQRPMVVGHDAFGRGGLCSCSGSPDCSGRRLTPCTTSLHLIACAA